MWTKRRWERWISSRTTRCISSVLGRQSFCWLVCHLWPMWFIFGSGKEGTQCLFFLFSVFFFFVFVCTNYFHGDDDRRWLVCITHSRVLSTVEGGPWWRKQPVVLTGFELTFSQQFEDQQFRITQVAPTIGPRPSDGRFQSCFNSVSKLAVVYHIPVHRYHEQNVYSLQVTDNFFPRK